MGSPVHSTARLQSKKLTLLILLFAVYPAWAAAQTQNLIGEVLNEDGQPIAGARCTLTGGMLPQAGLAETTGRKGDFEFHGLLPATYAVTCAASGYEPIQKSDLQITDAVPPTLQLILPKEVVVRQQVEVKEKAPAAVEQQASQPVELTGRQLISLPLAEQKFQAALPLIPGVIRTPDGKINIKGTAETQSLLLVDAADAADPITGSFSVNVPVVAIESLQVLKNTYSAEYGRFSGGITEIETRAPSAKWGFEVQNIPPNPRIEAGHLAGIADFNPRVYVTGPVIPGRLNFSEAVAYDVDKTPVRGLAWPANEMKSYDFNSFTTLQYVPSARHLLTVNANVFPERREFANINSLVPQTASSNYGQQGFLLELRDTLMRESGGILSTVIQGMKFDSNAYGQGLAPMLVTPNGWGGNFFNTYDRASDQEQIEESYGFPPGRWLGSHQTKVGVDLERRSFEGTSASRPVSVNRADGSLAERIDFQGPGQLSATDAGAGAFVQDHWMLNTRLAFDLGLRYSGETLGKRDALAPRFGFVFAPQHNSKTILRGGIGVFYNHLALISGDFTGNPTRLVSYYDPQGNLSAGAIPYLNAYKSHDSTGHVVPTFLHPRTTPYNITWNVEADREIRPRAVVKVSYLSSRTRDQFVVDPVAPPVTTTSALLLANNGRSSYSEFEAALRWRRGENSEWNIAYVHSKASGDLNAIDQVYVPFEQPVIRPNVYSNLPADVPNRLITWAAFRTHIWGIIASPVLDYHSGFPYSFVDELQNYVGRANSHRFPRFLSLDLKLSKEFRLPLPYLKNYRLLGQLTVFNVTNQSNPRDVFNNITSPYFLHYVGFQHRSLDTGIDVVY